MMWVEVTTWINVALNNTITYGKKLKIHTYLYVLVYHRVKLYSCCMFNTLYYHSFRLVFKCQKKLRSYKRD